MIDALLPLCGVCAVASWMDPQSFINAVTTLYRSIYRHDCHQIQICGYVLHTMDVKFKTYLNVMVILLEQQYSTVFSAHYCISSVVWITPKKIFYSCG